MYSSDSREAGKVEKGSEEAGNAHVQDQFSFRIIHNVSELQKLLRVAAV